MTGGHILEMITRLRNNEMIRGRVNFRQMRKFYLNALEAVGLKSVPLTEAQILSIRERIKTEHKRQQKRAFLVFILSIFATAIFISTIIILLTFYL